MSRLIADTPILEAYVRNKFFHDGDAAKDGYTFCYVYGFRAEPVKTPTFQVMTQQGAQWARVPIHMLCEKPCDELPLNLCTWWDCYGYDFTVHRFDFLRGHTCSAHGRDDKMRRGVYRFTVDWEGGFGEVPDQHKQHHIIGLESGQLIAYPNNHLVWHDESWITGIEGKPDWIPHTTSYSVEESLFGRYGGKRK